jgi:hypothetical protein
MAAGGPGVPLVGLQGGCNWLSSDEILSVRAYRDEMEELVVPRSNSF